jgi:asparagine synthase (glutamine-hydrolysing)
MCGIAGIVNVVPGAPPDRELALRMAAALRHRGPDGFGLYRDAEVALAHARLAIIDRDGGWQPMEADGVWICFNGEIFNYVELREELAAAGHAFKSQSDTEVLLRAYLAWGVELFDRLNGQFAFAIWDPARRRVIFARDRTGILPLFWTVHSKSLRFASEVKALFADPAVPRAFSPEGLEEALTYWSALAPLTPFAGVHQLPAGSVAVLELGKDREPRVVSRWTPSFPPEPPARHEDAVERVREAMAASSTIRLRADVPVGSYLSGGLDSTLVAALVARHEDVPLRTFSVEFGDREFDESEFQRAATAHLGTSHSAVMCSDAKIAEVFPDVVWHAEAPLLRTAPAPLLVLSRLVRESGFRVVLTGEGADETFAGYDIFQLDKVRRFWARHPASAWRPRLLMRLYPYLARSPVAQVEMAKAFFGKNLAATDDPFYAHRTRWDATARIQLMLAPPMKSAGALERLRARLPPDFMRWSPLARAQWLEMETLLTGYLLSSQGDRMLMASSVEGRFPFLDPAVIDLAASLRDDDKLRVLDEKHVLKRAAAPLVPPAIRSRQKQPYRAPVARPFFTGAPEWVEECLAPAAIEEAGVWLPAAVAGLAAKCRKTGGERMSNTDDMAICAVLSAQLLHRELIARPRAPGAAEPLGVDVDRV